MDPVVFATARTPCQSQRPSQGQIYPCCLGLEMNDWDRNNLHFILDSDEATLEDFYSWATEDDLAYALSLVREAKTELLLQEADILDEMLTDATEDDVSEASAMLKQFQL